MRALVILSFFLCFNFLANANSGENTTFIQLGLIHNYHFEEGYHYPSSTLISVVEKVRPDLICGEATKKEWKEGLAGLFPFENRILQFAARKNGATFVAVDWRTTYEEVSGVFAEIKKHMTDDDISKAKFERDRLDEDFENTFMSHAGKMFFSYLHTSFWKDAGLYHTQSERLFGDVPNGFWYRRNANIAFNCYQAAKKVNAKKVLVAYGAEHQYILDALLNNMPKAKSIPLGSAVRLSQIELGKRQLPEVLKIVFSSDLQALKKYTEQLPNDDPERNELEKKRIPSLKKIIQTLFQ